MSQPVVDLAPAWMPLDAPIIRAAAHVICLDDAGRMLLARISEPTPDDGRWTLPGGGLLLGEPPQDGAIREVAEETGLVVELTGVLAPYSFFIERSVTFGGRPLHFVSFVFGGRVVGGTIRDEVAGTTDRAAWFSREEMLTLPLVEMSRLAMTIAWPAAG